MAAWTEHQIDESAINSGNEYIEGDKATIDQLNAIIEGALFASNRVAALGDGGDYGSGTTYLFPNIVKSNGSAYLAIYRISGVYTSFSGITPPNATYWMKIVDAGYPSWIRYSANADGTDFTETWSSGQNYIGFAISATAPINKSDYTWALFRGEQGIQGIQGIQGEQGIQGIQGIQGVDGNGSYKTSATLATSGTGHTVALSTITVATGHTVKINDLLFDANWTWGFITAVDATNATYSYLGIFKNVQSVAIGSDGFSFDVTYNDGTTDNLPFDSENAVTAELVDPTSAAAVSVAATPAHYTPDDGFVEGHLGGIDDKLGSLDSLKIGGNTLYGGTIVTDFNAIEKSGFYTGYGTATGAPDSGYSWFVLHQNSNAGIVSMTQRATAYAKSVNGQSLIYERVKTSSSWGAWHRIFSEKKLIAEGIVAASSYMPLDTYIAAYPHREFTVKIWGEDADGEEAKCHFLLGTAFGTKYTRNKYDASFSSSTSEGVTFRNGTSAYIADDSLAYNGSEIKLKVVNLVGEDAITHDPLYFEALSAFQDWLAINSVGATTWSEILQLIDLGAGASSAQVAKLVNDNTTTALHVLIYVDYNEGD